MTKRLRPDISKTTYDKINFGIFCYDRINNKRLSMATVIDEAINLWLKEHNFKMIISERKLSAFDMVEKMKYEEESATKN